MQTYRDVCGTAALIALGALLICLPADGLSDTVCDNIQAEWQSDEPRLQGAFPFYTLLGVVRSLLSRCSANVSVA